MSLVKGNTRSPTAVGAGAGFATASSLFLQKGSNISKPSDFDFNADEWEEKDDNRPTKKRRIDHNDAAALADDAKIHLQTKEAKAKKSRVKKATAEGKFEDAPAEKPKPKARKPRAKVGTDDEVGNDIVGKPRRKVRAKKDSETAGDLQSEPQKRDSLSTKKGTRRKSSSDGQTILAKGKVTKPRCVERSKTRKRQSAEISSNPKKAVDDSTSAYFITRVAVDHDRDLVDLELERAVARRSEWTPPKESGPLPATAEVPDDPRDMGGYTGAESSVETPCRAFGDILGNFSYVKDSNVANRDDLQRQCGNTTALLRKNQLECLIVGPTSSKTTVATPKIAQNITGMKDNSTPNGAWHVLGPSPAHTEVSSTKRSRSPRKKPLTITAKASAPYLPQETAPSPANSAPILNYFARKDPEAIATHKPKPRKKATTKPNSSEELPKSKAKRKSKKAEPEVILLSPESAFKTWNDQDMLFGTSSQLAREESPTMIRELQQALELSANDSQNPSDTYLLNSSTLSGSSSDSSLSLCTANRNLWSVASRDQEGSCLEVNKASLPRSSKPINVDSPALKPGARSTPLEDTKAERNEVVSGDVWTVLQDDSPREKVIKGNADKQETEDQELNVDTKAATVPKDIFAPMDGADEPNTVTALEAPMPDFNGCTDAQLSKQISDYGFKPLKTRKGMINMLEKCWASKNRTVLQPLETKTLNVKVPSVSVPTDASTDAPQKRPRGRPRKDATGSSPTKATKTTKATKAATASKVAKASAASEATAPVISQKPTKAKQIIADEIEDSEAEVTPPSSPKALLTPSALELSPASTAAATPTLSPEAAQKLLFSRITEAITTDPRSQDKKQPTWHEKILMYDPIVLEDLATWLNTRGLARVGEDREVSALEVRKWCEERSVCCLWRETLNGKARARY